jgi:hypothetical protein
MGRARSGLRSAASPYPALGSSWRSQLFPPAPTRRDRLVNAVLARLGERGPGGLGPGGEASQPVSMAGGPPATATGGPRGGLVGAGEFDDDGSPEGSDDDGRSVAGGRGGGLISRAASFRSARSVAHRPLGGVDSGGGASAAYGGGAMARRQTEGYSPMGGATLGRRATQAAMGLAPAASVPVGGSGGYYGGTGAAAAEAERLERIERSVARLAASVEASLGQAPSKLRHTSNTAPSGGGGPPPPALGGDTGAGGGGQRRSHAMYAAGGGGGAAYPPSSLRPASGARAGSARPGSATGGAAGGVGPDGSTRGGLRAKFAGSEDVLRASTIVRDPMLMGELSVGDLSEVAPPSAAAAAAGMDLPGRVPELQGGSPPRSGSGPSRSSPSGSVGQPDARTLDTGGLLP